MPRRPGLTIGSLARAADVPSDTLRYYERRGLLPTPPRNSSGYRLFPADAVNRVQFIKRAQGLGFTLEEIGELLALRGATPKACDRVERKARGAIARIDAKVSELHRIRSALDRLAETCRGVHPPEACPLLIALDEIADDETVESDTSLNGRSSQDDSVPH